MDAQKKAVAHNAKDGMNWKTTMELWAFTAVKSPMIFFVRPRIMNYDGDTATVLVKLNRRNKNPFRSMYFGSLSTGAEVIPGIFSILMGRELKIRAAFSVKEFKGSFISKADDDVIFHCDGGSIIRDMMIRSSETGEAQQGDITVDAYKRSHDPDNLFGNKVAQFDIKFYIKALN